MEGWVRHSRLYSCDSSAQALLMTAVRSSVSVTEERSAISDGGTAQAPKVSNESSMSGTRMLTT